MKTKLSVIVFIAGFIMVLAFLPESGGRTAQNPFRQTVSDSYITAEAATVIDAETGKTLYGKNENEKLFPASTTKIMTAMLALEYGDLQDVITVGKEARMKTPGESTAWLREGQTLTLKELLAGLMLPSGNDAARTIGIYIGQKQSGDPHLSDQSALDYFTGMMNQKAKQLGAVHTHFMNPHGLHHPNHYSTAHDLAIIAKAAMSNPQFKELVSTRRYTDTKVTYQNTNKLLDESSGFYYEGANGIKTGFTGEAGYCLVSSAERDGRKLIAVVLKSTKTDVWGDSIALLKNGFKSEYVRK